MTDERNHEPIRFELRPGETFTYDRGGEGPDIVLTASASASANTALAALEVIPPSPLRDAAITAQSTIGGMTTPELQRELAILSAEGQEPDPKFGLLPVATISRFIEFELDAWRVASDKKHSWLLEGSIAVGGVLLGGLLVYFGLS